MSAPRLAALLLTGFLIAGCGDASPNRAESPRSARSLSPPQTQAQQYLDALVGTASCDDVWKLVVSEGEDQSEFCAALKDYRTEVRALTLGETTDSAEAYTIFAVRVDYLDGSPPVLDSEVEIDAVDGEWLVAPGLP